MTRKHFTAMAIEFGALLRNYPMISPSRAAIWETVEAFSRVAKTANSAFDADRFFDFVEEVANGERDLDGKKVTR